ncbi:MAG: DUF4340 domain-containing protein [Bacteroidetes bacterium]|nr:hypothetical protein [Bacteroidia bacterium]MCB0849964.1 DUF4340 domain-containing protein [Bacteroidota bacterium]MCE7954393.1 DUF4340 domain-containing protein [Bacteroidetes bacterium CHB6]MCB8929978.1 DUF4340 domain-containing protein [Bacteroidia bacterium]MCO5289963.1 DUF4340 domain-containing protein [Bacteroidota bacterium]
MNQNRILLLVAVLLISVAGYFYFNSTSGTIKKELRDFAVKDTAAITKIFIADKKGNQATLERKSSALWTINGKYPARQDAINTLLTTMKLIEVRSPVGKAALNNIIKELSATGTKVEIYEGDKKIKTYYVGGPTQDMLGTYMYLENSTVPFVIHIPGFNGYLSTRYFADATDWRSRVIFNYGEGQIQFVKVTNNDEPDNSFRITKQGDSYVYYPGINSEKPQEIYQSQIVAYLAKYQLIGFERPTYDLDKTYKDSLLATIPSRVLEVKSVDGKDDIIRMYKKPADTGTLTSTDPVTGEARVIDPDRMYAQWNNDTNLIVVQYYVMDKLFNKPDKIKGFGGL